MSKSLLRLFVFLLFYLSFKLFLLFVMRNPFLVPLFISSLALLPFVSKAEPFIDTSNVFLRADLQLLADQGHINIPLTTYPLMWADVVPAINRIDETKLSDESENAYWHVRQQYLRSKKNAQSIEMNIATDESRFVSFGNENREGSFTKANFSYMGDNWAVKFSPSVSEDDRRSKNVRADGSYLAGFLGNWVVSVGQQDRWYGPGLDTNLALTNNARPLPSIALTRKSSQAFVMPFFNEIQIPWNLTTSMGQFEEEREVPNTWLWTFRLNFKPTQNLEVGLTRLAQWNGDGRPSDLSTFWHVLKGEDNCGGVGPSIEECNAGKEPGNQLAGYDFRYSFNHFNFPLAVHMQMIAEDGDRKGGLSIFGEERYMYGIESRLDLFNRNWLTYIEYTDTFADCSDGVNAGDGSGVGTGNCYYEHHIYKTGMRYQGRVLGSAYENDAETLVFGMVSQLNGLDSWEFKAKYLDLNNDNSDRYPNDPDMGNTVTKIAEEVISLSLKYQKHHGRFKFTMGGNLDYSTFQDDEFSSDFSPNIYFNLHYNL